MTADLNWRSFSLSLFLLLKDQIFFKYCVITSAAAIVLIEVNTILISQKSTKNADSFRCSSKTYQQFKVSKKWDSKYIDWFGSFKKNNLKGRINVLKIHPFGLTKRGKILLNWIKPQKNPLQLLCAMELFTNQLQKWNKKNYTITKTYVSIIYVWHINYICIS